ncbi:aldo/keto reductase [Halobellus captivus]|uniref:aldo/keto reductase n=1 Tax=Halobellus captivus TaxID=2592614 RepID=UPI00119F9D95|nr:aldo/keto reductase [Halobellus captivus]
MEYTTLGETGMTVSKICLGCMSFGSNARRDWVLGEEQSREIIERAIDLGVNFFDTANVYSYGDSERVLGNVLSEYDRERLVVGTKVLGQMDEDNPNSGGLSRKSIDQELRHSLDRLSMDRVDLYQIHRWDYSTPIDETLKALDTAVEDGLVHNIGACSMWAYQFAESLRQSEILHTESFSTMQNQYNLTYREEEREMLPLCEQKGIGVVPWSALARGFLTRPHEEFTRTERGQHISKDDRISKRIDAYRANGGIEINERVEALAEEKGVSMAQIALAWLFQNDYVDAPLIGVTSIEHLEDAVEALEISLSKSNVTYLEEPYNAVNVVGHK